MSTEIPLSTQQGQAQAMGAQIAAQVARATEEEKVKGRYLKGWSGSVLTVIVIALGLIPAPTYAATLADGTMTTIVTLNLVSVMATIAVYVIIQGIVLSNVMRLEYGRAILVIVFGISVTGLIARLSGILQNIHIG